MIVSEVIDQLPLIITVIGTLGGAFVGASVTGRNQKKLFNVQKEWEEQKEKRKLMLKKVDTYNKLLKINGENKVIDYNQGNFTTINLGIYRENFRPLLFEYFHLLDDSIANIVVSMDKTYDTAAVYEELDENDEKFLITDFHSLINEIEEKVQDFRKRL